jgi:hypothetical protein
LSPRRGLEMATGGGAVDWVKVVALFETRLTDCLVTLGTLRSIGDLAKAAFEEVTSISWKNTRTRLELRRMNTPGEQRRVDLADFEAASAEEPLPLSVPLPDGSVRPGTWFRLDIIETSVPQGGESNPHARDAGARAGRETETPLRFRRPLVRRRRRRPLSLTLPPLPLGLSPFVVAGGPVGAGAGSAAPPTGE